jgi:hypothetical protein
MPSVMCGPERSARLGAGVGGGQLLKASWMASRGVFAFVSLFPLLFENSKLSQHDKKLWFVIIKPFGVRIWILMLLYLWTRLRVSFNAYIRSLCFSIDLPGVNPTTNDRMILYYCLMTKVDRS